MKVINISADNRQIEDISKVIIPDTSMVYMVCQQIESRGRSNEEVKGDSHGSRNAADLVGAVAPEYTG